MILPQTKKNKTKMFETKETRCKVIGKIKNLINQRIIQKETKRKEYEARRQRTNETTA